MDGRERGSKLVAGDGHEVRLHLVELAQTFEGLPLLRPQTGSMDHQGDLVGQPVQKAHRTLVEGVGLAALHVDDPDHLLPDPEGSRHLRSHGGIGDDVAGEVVDVRDDQRPAGHGHGSGHAMPQRDAVREERHPGHAPHHQLVSLPEEDGEGLEGEVTAERLRHELGRRLRVLRGDAGEDGGVERRQLAAGQ